jgi:transposase
MKTGMLYDPRRKVLYNFYPINFYIIRKNVDVEIDDGLYIFSGNQQVEIYGERGFHIMYSAEMWMTEHPVQMLSA